MTFSLAFSLSTLTVVSQYETSLNLLFFYYFFTYLLVQVDILLMRWRDTHFGSEMSE